MGYKPIITDSDKQDVLQTEIKQLRESLKIAGIKYALALKELGMAYEEIDNLKSKQPKAKCA